MAVEKYRRSKGSWSDWERDGERQKEDGESVQDREQYRECAVESPQ